MKSSTAWSLAALFVVARAALADEPPPPQQPAPPAEKPPEVALEPSFSLPQQEGSGVSHVPAVVFTKGGSVLVTGTSQGEVVFWEAATRKLEKKHKFADSPVAALAIDPSAKVLVALLENGALQAIDLESGKTLAAEEKIEGKTLAISPAGDLLAIARGPKVELRKLPSLEAVKQDGQGEGAAARLDLGGQVNAIAFSPDGSMIAACTEAGLLRIVGPPQGGPLGTVFEATRPGPLYAVAFAPDSTALTYGGHERILYQTDIGAKKDDVIATGQPYFITAAGYSPDGKTIAIGDESCDIWLFDVRAKKNLFHSKHHVECWLNGVAWAPDNETFLFACRPNTLAATPSLYMPNVYAEAQQCVAVVDARKGLEAACAEMELAYAGNEELRRLRDELQVAMADRVKAGAAALGYAYQGQAATFQGTDFRGLGAPSDLSGEQLAQAYQTVDALTIVNAGDPSQPYSIAGGGVTAGTSFAWYANATPVGPQTESIPYTLDTGGTGIYVTDVEVNTTGVTPTLNPVIRILNGMAAPQQVGGWAWFPKIVDMQVVYKGLALAEEKRARELDAKVAELDKALRERPELAPAIARVEERKKQEKEALEKEVSRLSQSFNINQWRMKK